MQKLIPQLEEAIQRKDQQLKAQQGTVENHIRRIAELEAEVTSLQISICKSAVFAVHQHASETLIRMEVKKNFIGFAFAASLIGEKVGVGCR
ncbi:unnamed protein product [Heligmosomoides polygyrus]|uniref:Uncharacterized protein n=1 Tax=Heligmosomoides polygyrus TaxID=6339 RepID=A0A3P8IY28_HELPZ|nr:unnamed protein product [Heligmosomoides polygyrus]